MSEKQWDIVLKPSGKWYHVDLKGVWHYRDLIRLFVRRDFVAQYKQSLIGPLWILIQPLLTTILYSVIFGFIAKLPMGGIPPALFIMTAFIPWTYFSECVSKTANTFTGNSAIFGKVYFPRLVTPISVMISNMIKLGVQLLLLAGLFTYYAVFKGTKIDINAHAFFLPLLIIILGMTGMAIGLIVSSLTTRYRDLGFLINFIIQFLMYGSAVVIPLKVFESHHTVMSIIRLNPLSWIIESFRVALLNTGQWSWGGIAYAAGCMIFLISFAFLLFSKVERTFMDRV